MSFVSKTAGRGAKDASNSGISSVQRVKAAADGFKKGVTAENRTERRKKVEDCGTVPPGITTEEISKREMELAKEAEAAAVEVMTGLKNTEDLQELCALREALEKERAVRRIPAEAVRGTCKTHGRLMVVTHNPMVKWDVQPPCKLDVLPV
eukprot:8366934-Pyramimonas_sp.AAC.1